MDKHNLFLQEAQHNMHLEIGYMHVVPLWQFELEY